MARVAPSQSPPRSPLLGRAWESPSWSLPPRPAPAAAALAAESFPREEARSSFQVLITTNWPEVPTLIVLVAFLYSFIYLLFKMNLLVPNNNLFLNNNLFPIDAKAIFFQVTIIIPSCLIAY